MKLRLLLLTFLFSAFSWGQVTIVSDGLNNSTTLFSITGGNYYTGNSAAADRPATSPFASEGTHAYGVSNGTTTLTTSSFDTSSYTSVFLNFDLAAFSIGSSTNGLDAGDIVTVEVSPDGGSNWFSTVRVLGASNAYWAYSTGTGLASTTYDGDVTPVNFQPAAGGNRTTDGYSRVEVLGLPQVANLQIRITLLNNSTSERWLVDNFIVRGTAALPSPPVITSSLVDSGTVGAPYTYNIIATNSPTSYSATSLPAGLSINTSTGEITGIVGTAGVYNIDITATNAYGSDTQTLVVTFSVGPCGSESFTNSNATASYADNSFVGDNGVTWTYVQSRDENGDANGSGINGKALMLRRLSDNSRVTSSTVSTGIQDFSVTLYKGFTGGGNRQVELFVNGISQGTSTPFDDYLPHVFTVNNINISGNVVIEIRNITGSQVIVDDISWTCYNVNNEIDVEGNSVSIVNGDNTPSLADDTDFGTTTLGNDVSHTFTITNAGPDDLDISGITITGVDAADFYISVNPASTVAAGGSTTFEVTFSPAAAGTSNATINIANNDSDENPYTFDIVAVSTVCTPTTSVSSITPASGPIGTVVTINGSGFTTATSVSISGVSASFTIVSNTVIEVIVPTITASGNIVIQDAGGCDLSFSSFSLITEDNSSCEGIAVTTDLIIYDLHDEFTGNGGFITLYNGTALTVDLTNYSIWRTSNYGDGLEIDYANLTGTLAPGALGVIRVNVAGCGPASTNGTIDNGFNGDDQIQLRDAAGLVVIDDVHTYFDKGYYMVRNTGALSARTTFVAADWNTTPLIAGQCWPSAGLVPPTGNGSSPSVTLNPVDVNAGCPSTTATLTVAGSEGVVGGFSLAYQWYVNVPGNAGWTAVSNGGVYSGATTATLNISSTSGLNNYQYYCQIREDNATCYTATDAAIIKDGATVWNGSVWSNGVPDITKTATIDGDYDTAVDGSFSCCSLLVNATYTLDIQAVDYVEIQNDLTVNGTLNVWDDGSLVQVDDSGVNTGNISYERNTTGVALDYVYWSSPVDGVNTPATGQIFSWNPTIANPNGGWGYWISSRNTPMAPAVGYIMRNIFTRTFTGVPRNGVIQPTIARANYTDVSGFTGTNGILITRFDDNWNLVGNPYPSAISALDFLTANTNIEGAVRVWTHGTSPSTSISDPVYDDYAYNYTVNDYIVYNGTGTVSGPGGFNGFIAGGQSFMINMNDGAAASGTVTFNNSMRDRNHNNEQFYRQSSTLSKSASIEEKHRIWLDLADANKNSTRTLVGYVSGATYEKDRLYDAVSNAQSNEMSIFTILNNERMLIQGRTLPFDNQDKVQISIKIPSSGLYSIGISAMDGLFDGTQDIYLEDKELNIIFDLKQTPYSFYANQGEFKDRFVLRYTNETLSTEEIVNGNDVVIGTLDNGFNIISNKQKIKNVTIHNVLGQLIYNRSNVNSNNLEISELLKNNQALVINVILDNDVKITKKVIY